MPGRKSRAKRRGDRLTITLAPGQRELLVDIARRNNATLGFVVRYALAQFARDHRAGQLRLDLPVD